MAKTQDEWQKLNKRQQTYMKALYETDQEQEAEEKIYAARTLRSRPADEWRWMEYAEHLFTGYTPLKERLFKAKVVDAGTGSTFEALKERGYVLIRHELTIVGNTIPFLRLTTKGRKLVRSALQIQPSQKWPTGQLREWHWKALCAAWQAGDEGIESDTGYYARIGWNTWLRLRDYKVKGEERPLADEERVSIDWTSHAGGFMTYSQDIRMKITEFGKYYYRENWQRYRELYPDVDAPEPQEEDCYEH